MAKVRGNDGKVLTGAAEVAEVTKWDMTVTPVIVSDVAIGDTWAESAAGSKSWSGSIECFYDATDTTGQNVLINGNTINLRLFPSGNDAGEKYYFGTAIIGAVTKSGTKDAYQTATFPYTGVDTQRDYWGIATPVPTGGTLTVTLTLSLPTGKVVVIDWGDNTTDTVTGPQVETEYANIYTAGTYNLGLGGDIDSLTYFSCANAILGGDILDFNCLTGLTTFSLTGTGITTYTAGTLPAWDDATITLTDMALSETEVDNFLADLDTAGGEDGTLYIAGTNAAPSTAGDTSVSNLEGKGWTVTTS